MRMIDTHFHFDFILNQRERKLFLSILSLADIEVIAQTVIPSNYRQLGTIRPQRVALGFHPWWIRSQKQIEQELVIFKEQLPTTRFIGEIGLDFSSKILETVSIDCQVAVFEELLKLIAQQEKNVDEPYILSIHSVKAANEVIDLLEKMNSYQVAIIPIIHGFNGTSDQLMRHIKNGGYLSVNLKMLQSKKGRAYAKQIPKERLLLETDLPKGKWENGETIELLVKQVVENLEATLLELSIIRNEDMREIVHLNQKQLGII